MDRNETSGLKPGAFYDWRIPLRVRGEHRAESQLSEQGGRSGRLRRRKCARFGSDNNLHPPVGCLASISNLGHLTPITIDARKPN